MSEKHIRTAYINEESVPRPFAEIRAGDTFVLDDMLDAKWRAVDDPHYDEKFSKDYLTITADPVNDLST